ncbi:hypothetical protein Tco_1221028 [Tanacetum coccineum]
MLWLMRVAYTVFCCRLKYPQSEDVSSSTLLDLDKLQITPRTLPLLKIIAGCFVLLDHLSYKFITRILYPSEVLFWYQGIRQICEAVIVHHTPELLELALIHNKLSLRRLTFLDDLDHENLPAEQVLPEMEFVDEFQTFSLSGMMIVPSCHCFDPAESALPL